MRRFVIILLVLINAKNCACTLGPCPSNSPSVLRGKDDKVCGYTPQLQDQRCKKSYSRSKATEICMENGGRLCSDEELINGEAADSEKSTGCGLDNQWIWTSSNCNDSSKKTISRVVKGNGKQNRCSKKMKRAFVRCCMDVDGNRAAVVTTGDSYERELTFMLYDSGNMMIDAFLNHVRTSLRNYFGDSSFEVTLLRAVGTERTFQIQTNDTSIHFGGIVSSLRANAPTSWDISSLIPVPCFRENGTCETSSPTSDACPVQLLGCTSLMGLGEGVCRNLMSTVEIPMYTNNEPLNIFQGKFSGDMFRVSYRHKDILKECEVFNICDDPVCVVQRTQIHAEKEFMKMEFPAFPLSMKIQNLSISSEQVNGIVVEKMMDLKETENSFEILFENSSLQTRTNFTVHDCVSNQLVAFATPGKLKGGKTHADVVLSELTLPTSFRRCSDAVFDLEVAYDDRRTFVNPKQSTNEVGYEKVKRKRNVKSMGGHRAKRNAAPASNSDGRRRLQTSSVKDGVLKFFMQNQDTLAFTLTSLGVLEKFDLDVVVEDVVEGDDGDLVQLSEQFQSAVECFDPQEHDRQASFQLARHIGQDVSQSLYFPPISTWANATQTLAKSSIWTQSKTTVIGPETASSASSHLAQTDQGAVTSTSIGGIEFEVDLDVDRGETRRALLSFREGHDQQQRDLGKKKKKKKTKAKGGHKSSGNPEPAFRILEQEQFVNALSITDGADGETTVNLHHQYGTVDLEVITEKGNKFTIENSGTTNGNLVLKLNDANEHDFIVTGPGFQRTIDVFTFPSTATRLQGAVAFADQQVRGGKMSISSQSISFASDEKNVQVPGAILFARDHIQVVNATFSSLVSSEVTFGSSELGATSFHSAKLEGSINITLNDQMYLQSVGKSSLPAVLAVSSIGNSLQTSWNAVDNIDTQFWAEAMLSSSAIRKPVRVQVRSAVMKGNNSLISLAIDDSKSQLVVPVVANVSMRATLGEQTTTLEIDHDFAKMVQITGKSFVSCELPLQKIQGSVQLSMPKGALTLKRSADFDASTPVKLKGQDTNVLLEFPVSTGKESSILELKHPTIIHSVVILLELETIDNKTGSSTTNGMVLLSSSGTKLSFTMHANMKSNTSIILFDKSGSTINSDKRTIIANPDTSQTSVSIFLPIQGQSIVSIKSF